MKLAYLHKVYFKDIQAGLIAMSVAYGLSYLPYSDLLQSLWILASSIYLSTRRLKTRLNEKDDQRHQRLNQERFAFWEKKEDGLDTANTAVRI